MPLGRAEWRCVHACACARACVIVCAWATGGEGRCSDRPRSARPRHRKPCSLHARRQSANRPCDTGPSCNARPRQRPFPLRRCAEHVEMISFRVRSSGPFLSRPARRTLRIAVPCGVVPCAVGAESVGAPPGCCDRLLQGRCLSGPFCLQCASASRSSLPRPLPPASARLDPPRRHSSRPISTSRVPTMRPRGPHGPLSTAYHSACHRRPRPGSRRRTRDHRTTWARTTPSPPAALVRIAGRG